MESSLHKLYNQAVKLFSSRKDIIEYVLKHSTDEKYDAVVYNTKTKVYQFIQYIPSGTSCSFVYG